MEAVAPNSVVPKYEYPPLTNPHSIRLLKILPSLRVRAEIRCSLKVVELDKNPHYRALSYTWARPTGTRSLVNDETTGVSPDERWILIDGARCEVTPNLHDGLLQIRQNLPRSRGVYVRLPSGLYHNSTEKRDATAPLWVDAICINQADVQERNAQVGMMARIYLSASVVIVWLGPAAQSAPAIAADIQSLAPAFNCHQEDLFKGRMKCDRRGFQDSEFLAMFGCSKWTPEQWKAICQFFQNRWFLRVWICQEIALAHRLEILWGHAVLQWHLLVSACAFLYWSDLGCYYPDEVESVSIINHQQAIMQVIRLNQMRDECGNDIALQNEFIQLARRMSRPSDFGVKEPNVSNIDIFKDLLMNISTCNATDRRDTIFGLLGILERRCQLSGFPKLPLRPDYGLTPAQIYQQVTKLMIQETKSLRILSSVKASAKQQTTQHLPSWVPDFSYYGNAHIQVPQPARKHCAFNASKYGSFSILDFHIEQTTLKVQGIRLAIVSCLGQSRIELAGGRHLDKTVKVIRDGPLTYFNGQSRTEVWWRTCVGDMTRFEYPAPARLEDSCAAWLLERLIDNIDRCLSRGWTLPHYLTVMSSCDELERSGSNGVIPPLSSLVQIWNERAQNLRQAEQTRVFGADFEEDLAKRAQSFDDAFIDTMYGLVFGTSEGYIGNGPDILRQGDMIWIIKGSDVPLAVRKVADVATDGIHCSFLGEAYVHGAMHGEALYGTEPNWETLCLI